MLTKCQTLCAWHNSDAGMNIFIATFGSLGFSLYLCGRNHSINIKSYFTMDELQNIQSKIYVIRGQRVMLDRDLAKAYGVETKALNQAVKRNIQRFEGEDYMFQLTKDECLRSQIVTLNEAQGKHLQSGEDDS